MRLFLIFLFSFIVLNAAEMGVNGGGCVLAQEGKVSVIYDGVIYKNVEYKANAKSGKNFREIFIGSKMILSNGVSMKIIDYVPNKRVKGKPKTGLFMVDVTSDTNKESVSMAYIFDKGVMSVTGVINKSIIGFSTKVNYSLCSVKIK